MKSKMLITLCLILSLNAAAFPQDKCRSAGEVFTDVNKKWGEVIIATGCIVGVNVGTGGVAIALTLQCIAKADKYEKAAEEMVKYFNTAANNGRWTIGPRKIEWGTPQTGSVVSTLSRVFISPAPVDKDSITVKVKKTDGKAHADVIICKVDEKGNYVNLAQFEFAKGNDNDGQEISKTVSGVKGHLVQVRIDADSVVQKFEYKMTVTK